MRTFTVLRENGEPMGTIVVSGGTISTLKIVIKNDLMPAEATLTFSSAEQVKNLRKILEKASGQEQLSGADLSQGSVKIYQQGSSTLSLSYQKVKVADLPSAQKNPDGSFDEVINAEPNDITIHHPANSTYWSYTFFTFRKDVNSPADTLPEPDDIVGIVVNVYILKEIASELGNLA